MLICVSRYMLWTVDEEAYAQGAEKGSISDEGAFFCGAYFCTFWVNPSMQVSIYMLVYASRYILWTVDGEAYAQGAKKKLDFG